MSFLETPRFPDDIDFGLIGGPAFSTDIKEISSGFEVANANWSLAKRQWAAEHGPHGASQTEILQAFFLCVLGRYDRFRFKDWTDYLATTTNGMVGTAGIGTAMAQYQLYKKYVTGALAHYRPIRKPVSGAVSIFRGDDPVTLGSSPGNASLDTTTGIVIFVSDNTQGITNLVPSADIFQYTTITIAGAQPELTYLDYVYLDGVGGTIGAALNGKTHRIIVKNNPNDLTFYIETNTYGLSWTSGGSCYAYPQANETLTWSGEFDVPVRFDSDDMKLQIIAPDAFMWNNVGLREVKL